MHKIKFSHEYYKMPEEEYIPNVSLTAKILEVLICNKEELSKEFLEYDTSFCECISKEKQTYKKGYYNLPDGKLIIILFLTINSSGRHIWTTIRKWTPEKEKFYCSIIGEQVKIVVEEQK